MNLHNQCYRIVTLSVFCVLLFNLNFVYCDNNTFLRTVRDVYQSGQYPNNQRCDLLITKKEGFIFSPNFPSNYRDSIVCGYQIVRCAPDVCQLEVTFTHFDLEHSPQCTADYLDLDDGIGRICGTLPPNTKKIVTFPNGANYIKFIFHSDGYNTRKGFQANVKQIRNSCVGQCPDNSCSIPDVTQRPTPLPDASRDGRSIIYLGSFCDIYIGDYFGDIRSPGYPYGYPPQQQCTYTIHRPSRDTCKVELTFHQFDLSNPNGRKLCNNDYLELPDRTRHCGRIGFMKRNLWYSATSDYMLLHLVTSTVQPYGSSIGFWIEVRQFRNSCQLAQLKVPKCDQTLNGLTSYVRSVNYPRPYGVSQQCVYFIEPLDQRTCAFEMQFNQFKIEPSNDYGHLSCFKDFFHLPNSERICGTTAGSRMFYFPKERDRVAMFYFSSDNTIQDTGYDISIRQQPNSCYHEHRPSVPNPDPIPGTVLNPVQDPIPGLITGPIPDQISGQLPTRGPIISITSKPVIYDPIKPEQQLNRSFPNNLILDICDRQITSLRETIISPNYPHYYPPLSRCIYTIYKSSTDVCQIQLELLKFDVEHDNNCLNDFLLIESTGEKICGRYEGMKDTVKKIIAFPSFARQLRLIFNSDRQISRPGFEIRIDQIPNSCNLPILADNSKIYTPGINPGINTGINPGINTRINTGFTPGINMGINPQINTFVAPPQRVPQMCGSSSSIVSVFTSDNYPLAYNSDTDCIYRIYRANRNVCRAEVIFEDFEVDSENPDRPKVCANDYLEIDGSKYCGRRSGERFLVNFPQRIEELILKFHTDHTDRFGGFRIRIRQIDDNCRESSVPNTAQNEFFTGSTEACHKMIYEQRELQIISPGFSTGQYKPYLECVYIIKKSTKKVCALEMNFMAFSIEESKLCQKDFLEIGDNKLCGKLPFDAKRTYQFSGDTINMRFHSDSDGTGAGFIINYKQIEC